MKVLHILNTGSYSGAENVVATILVNMKNDIDGVYSSLDGSIRDILKEKDISFVSFEKLTIKNLKKVIEEVQPDLIHAHDFTAGIIASLTTFRIPIINHLHNNSPWLKTFSIKSIVYGISCLRYKKILTVSDSVMDEYIFGRFFKHKSLVVGNPINLHIIQEKALENPYYETYDIAFLGRLTEQKNPMLFLEIIKEIKKTIPSLKVVMIGDGELRSQVEKKIEELELTSTVKLTGFVNNPYAILNKCKVMCMPSLWEGFGLAAVEALGLGKPVVATDVGGLGQIVNNDCGKLCYTKEEFVEEIGSLLLNDDLYQQKSKQALIRANQYHNVESYCQQLQEIYQELTKGK